MAKTTSRKAQVVLSREQYELLEASARARGKPVSSLLREHLEQTLLASLERSRREAALRWLISQELPTGDWETIERELEGRWKECEGD